MGRLLNGILAILCLSTLAANASRMEQIQISETMVNISEVFVPSEPKSNGDSYVVVNGYFPNSCYRFERVEVKDKNQMVHDVRVIGMVSKTMCLMVLVPYMKEVVLGKLAKGEHSLRFTNGDDTYFERTLVVR